MHLATAYTDQLSPSRRKERKQEKNSVNEVVDCIIIFTAEILITMEKLSHLFGKVYKSLGEFLAVAFYGCLSIPASRIPTINHVM